tara:strand:- start:1548 stop:2285 length:738 start_codon:yes stop_codon:yes gene_type:complete
MPNSIRFSNPLMSSSNPSTGETQTSDVEDNFIVKPVEVLEVSSQQMTVVFREEALNSIFLNSNNSINYRNKIRILEERPYANLHEAVIDLERNFTANKIFVDKRGFISDKFFNEFNDLFNFYIQQTNFTINDYKQIIKGKLIKQSILCYTSNRANLLSVNKIIKNNDDNYIYKAASVLINGLDDTFTYGLQNGDEFVFFFFNGESYEVVTPVYTTGSAYDSPNEFEDKKISIVEQATLGERLQKI